MINVIFFIYPYIEEVFFIGLPVKKVKKPLFFYFKAHPHHNNSLYLRVM